MAVSKDKLKSLLLKVKEESKKAGLKLLETFKKLRSWHLVHHFIEGEKLEAVTDFYFVGLQNHYGQ